MTKLAELGTSRELLYNLTLRELRGKYKRSALGWTWSLVNPLATMVIFTIVFRVFLRVEPPVGQPSGLHNFAFFLMAGLLPWNFVSVGLTTGIGALVANENLIKKVYFPREIVVASTIFAGVVSFLIELGVLALALVVAGNMVLQWLVVVVVLVALLTVFVLGVALVLSVVNVYFRDTQYLFAVAMQIWFYATPILYPVSLVPEHGRVLGYDVPIRAIYGLNPMVRFVRVFRDCLYDLRFPMVRDLAVLSLVSFGALGIGAAVFNRLEPRLAEEL